MSLTHRITKVTVKMKDIVESLELDKIFPNCLHTPSAKSVAKCDTQSYLCDLP